MNDRDQMTEEARRFLAGLAFVITLLVLVALVRKARSAELEDVKVSPEKAKVAFGHEFFFDAGVQSLKGTKSCATCHRPEPEFGLSDGLKVAVGERRAVDPTTGQVGFGPLNIRNTISLWNCGDRLSKPSNADGRADGIYNSCLQAVADKLTLGMPSVGTCVARVNKRPRYQALARIAYGTSSVTEAQLRECVVAFLKTLRSDDLPADRFYRALQEKAASRMGGIRRSPFGRRSMSMGETPMLRENRLMAASGLPASGVRGGLVFMQHCAVCHDPKQGWSGDGFYNVGISSRSLDIARARGVNDLGREGVTAEASDRYKFAVPRLPECPRTQPYMHDGSIASLDDAVDHFCHGGRYTIGGRTFQDKFTDPLVRDINLNPHDTADVKVFVRLGFQDENYRVIENPHEAPR